MGLTRSSLFNSFGSKDSVFEECLRIYTQDLSEAETQRMLEEMGFLRTLQFLFEFVTARRPESPLGRGCFLVNSVWEVLGNTAPVSKSVKQNAARAIKRYESIVKQGITEELLPQDTDIRLTAKSIVTFLYGLNAMAKLERSPSKLDELRDHFLKSIGVRF